MTQTLLPGVTAERVPTSRLTMGVLSAAGRTGEHGPHIDQPEQFRAALSEHLDSAR